MTPDLETLARRAVACKHWRWMPGMMCYWKERGGASGQQVRPTSARVADLPMGPLPLAFCIVDPSAVYSNALPDLTDPATLGCLLTLVRGALGKPVWVRAGDYGNEVCWCDGPHSISILFPDRDADADSEVSALVAALEAAP